VTSGAQAHHPELAPPGKNDNASVEHDRFARRQFVAKLVCLRFACHTLRHV
jgi:hypothetical protein